MDIADITGDGHKSEIIVATKDAVDGKVMWEIKGRENWGGFDFHTDRLLIDDIDGDPGNGNELILCEGTLFNKDGTIRRQVGSDFDHGQTVALMKMREDYAGKQIVFGERNTGNIYCYDAGGGLIWKRGRYYGEQVHVGDIIPINWSGHGKKEVLCRYLGVFDGYGNLVKLPPHVECGSADLRVADMVGDERDEIIVTIGRTTYIIMNTAEGAG